MGVEITMKWKILAEGQPNLECSKENTDGNSNGLNEAQMNEYCSLHEAYQFLYKKYIVGYQDVKFDFAGLVNPFMKMDTMGLTGNKSYEKKINDIVDKQMQDAQNKALEKQLEEEKRIQNELNKAEEEKYLEEIRQRKAEQKFLESFGLVRNRKGSLVMSSG